MVTEESLAGMVVVVVPPDEVKTDETTGDGDGETVSVPPYEVTTVTGGEVMNELAGVETV
jgi:hypothetical protein